MFEVEGTNVPFKFVDGITSEENIMFLGAVAQMCIVEGQFVRV